MCEDGHVTVIFVWEILSGALTDFESFSFEFKVFTENI